MPRRGPSRKWRAGAALLACLALAAPASAQDPTTPTPAAPARPRKAKPGRFRLGPLYVTPRLELKNAGVDDNVFITRTAQVPDTSAVLSPSLEGVLPLGRRGRLSGNGYLDLNYFRRRSTERSTDFGGDGTAELELGPLLLTGSGGGRQARQRFTIELDDRILRQERWAEAGLGLKLSRKLRLLGSARSHVYEHDSIARGEFDLRQLLDREALTGTGEVRFALTRRTTLVGRGQVVEDRFLRVAPGLAQRARSYRAVGGLEFDTRAVVSGNVFAGAREFPQSGQAAPAYRGLVLQGELKLPFLFGGHIDLGTDRDVQYSASAAAPTQHGLRNTVVAERYRGELSLPVPFALLASGYAEYQHTRGVLPVLFEGREVAKADRAWTFGGSLLKRFGESLYLGGTVAFTRRRGTLVAFDYERWVYGVQGRFTP